MLTIRGLLIRVGLITVLLGVGNQFQLNPEHSVDGGVAICIAAAIFARTLGIAFSPDEVIRMLIGTIAMVVMALCAIFTQVLTITTAILVGIAFLSVILIPICWSAQFILMTIERLASIREQVTTIY